MYKYTQKHSRYSGNMLHCTLICADYNDAYNYDCVQVSRAAVEGYTGEGEPPCIVMTLSSAVSDETTPSKLTLPVTFTGVREANNILVIERRAEGNVVEYNYTGR